MKRFVLEPRKKQYADRRKNVFFKWILPIFLCLVLSFAIWLAVTDVREWRNAGERETTAQTENTDV